MASVYKIYSIVRFKYCILLEPFTHCCRYISDVIYLMPLYLKHLQCNPILDLCQLAPECHKWAVKQVCANSGAGHTDTRIYASLPLPDPVPALTEQGGFVLGDAGGGRRWQEGVLGWGGAVSWWGWNMGRISHGKGMELAMAAVHTT